MESKIVALLFILTVEVQIQFTRVEEHQSIEFTNNIIYTNSGKILLGNWKEANIKIEYNCYWDNRTREPLFVDMPFINCKKQKDINSVFADPLFVDAENYDFRLTSQTIARKIGFNPSDYEKAGVYGSEEWKRLAIPDSTRVALCLKR